MKGALTHELEVPAPAADVWYIFSGLRLGKLMVKFLPDVEKIEVVEGDGGEGTVLDVFVTSSGNFGQQVVKEKVVKVDSENRIRESIFIEGGYLAIGFQSLLFRFEVVEKDESSCIIKSTAEYELGEGAPPDLASHLDIAAVAKVAEAVKKYLADGDGEA